MTDIDDVAPQQHQSPRHQSPRRIAVGDVFIGLLLACGGGALIADALWDLHWQIVGAVAGIAAGALSIAVIIGLRLRHQHHS